MKNFLQTGCRLSEPGAKGELMFLTIFIQVLAAAFIMAFLSVKIAKIIRYFYYKKYEKLFAKYE